VAGMKKTKDDAEPTKSRTLNKTKANTAGQDEYRFFSSCSVVNKHNARYFYIWYPLKMLVDVTGHSAGSHHNVVRCKFNFVLT